MAMKQTTLCVPLDVKPGSCSRLCALLDALKQREDDATNKSIPNFHRLREQVPTLHFMSMSVFNSVSYDPIFIIEANFDGDASVFWGEIEALLGDMLRPMLCCCKCPLDNKADLYKAVTQPNSKEAIAPYLEAATQRPSVFFHGNRGLTRTRILDEQRLFLALRDEIDDPARRGPNPYRIATSAHAHAALRTRMLSRFAWLDLPAPQRVTAGEALMDKVRLLTFVVAMLTILALPGLIISSVMRWELYVTVIGLAAAAVALGLFLNWKPAAGQKVVNRVLPDIPGAPFWIALVAGLLITSALITAVLVPVVFGVTYINHAISHWLNLHPGPIEASVLMLLIVRCAALGLVTGIILILPALLLIVRRNEKADSSQDAPPQDERLLREILRREDWITQNHMGSIVLIKPGIFRSNIIRAGHKGLGLLLRVTPDARSGYLGSMRTVHFAHWAFLDNTSRLLFLSNFDHSWGSYLDDFIEKAHAGLTLAWGSGVGFPPARMLILDGASHGRQFKNWALASRTVSRFWYSAYPELSVDQIERNNRIANGLRLAKMTEKEAAQWVLDL